MPISQDNFIVGPLVLSATFSISVPQEDLVEGYDVKEAMAQLSGGVDNAVVAATAVITDTGASANVTRQFSVDVGTSNTASNDA